MTTLKTTSFVASVLMLALLGQTAYEAAAAEETTITLRVNGNGSIRPDLDGHHLRVGSLIWLKAIPAPGHIFTGWRGTDQGSAPESCFRVVPGLDLQANFLPNPFPALSGHYSGLIHSTNVEALPIGFFSFNLSSAGKLEGKLMRAGQKYTYDIFEHLYWEWPNEPIEQDGETQGWVFRNELSYIKGDAYHLDVFRQDLTSEIRVDFRTNHDEVLGTLTDAHEDAQWQPIPATWGADMVAHKAFFNARMNPAPQAGLYTLILPGGDGLNEPAGAGFATLKVDAGGTLNLTGFLGDGRAMSQRRHLAKNGQWPLFARLYADRGALAGWMRFSTESGEALTGTLTWSKPAGASTFVDGFTNRLAAVGSRYIARSKGTPLEFVNGVAVFRGGNLDAPWTRTFTIGPNGKVFSTSNTRFNLAFVPRTGLFKGTFIHPVSGKTVPFKGAVLQSQNCGYGHFLEANGKSGLVFIGSDQ